jgi:hypothetical protein
LALEIVLSYWGFAHQCQSGTFFFVLSSFETRNNNMQRQPRL